MESIQHYNHSTQTLEHPWAYKIQKLLELGCIKKINNDEYVCLPIPGYNVRQYQLKRQISGMFKCNCQGFSKRQDCSHVQALYQIIGKDQDQGVLF
jgi:hypothetical protein